MVVWRSLEKASIEVFEPRTETKNKSLYVWPRASVTDIFKYMSEGETLPELVELTQNAIFFQMIQTLASDINKIFSSLSFTDTELRRDDMDHFI